MEARGPLVVEVWRGEQVESRHRVHAVIADASGAPVTVHGEAGRAVFPRSAVKFLQALPLVESGAADAFGLGPRHLALACASHAGEPAHVATAAEMLTAAGLEARCLECGAHLPDRVEDVAALARAGLMPSALHNNCSGKHSGFLCLAVHEGMPTAGYVGLDHPVQQRVRAAMAEVTGVPHEAGLSGTDGCSIPTFAIPLSALAGAAARFGAAVDADPDRATAMRRLGEAVLAHPDMVAGTGGFDTVVMGGAGGRILCKTGAEGVYFASLPQLGLGIALKVEDGATRAARVALASLILSLRQAADGLENLLEPFARPVLRNWNGLTVGRLAVAPNGL